MTEDLAQKEGEGPDAMSAKILWSLQISIETN